MKRWKDSKSEMEQLLRELKHYESPGHAVLVIIMRLG